MSQPRHLPRSLLEYNITLAPGRKAVLIVPDDLTKPEAIRLGRILDSVAFEENEVRPIPVPVEVGTDD